MKLLRTEKINAYLSESADVSLDESRIGDTWIDYQLAIDLGKSARIPLIEFLRGTRVYHEPSASDTNRPPKTAEYVQLMERLRREQAEKSYQDLVGYNSNDEPQSISEITKEVNSQLTTIVNVLVSIFAVAWAFWYWCSSWPLPSRTLMSLFAAIFVGVAEVVVFSGYQRRLAQSKQKSIPEKRQIIKEYVFQRGETIEKEYISGDGKDSVKHGSEKPVSTGLKNRSEHPSVRNKCKS